MLNTITRLLSTSSGNSLKIKSRCISSIQKIVSAHWIASRVKGVSASGCMLQHFASTLPRPAKSAVAVGLRCCAVVQTKRKCCFIASREDKCLTLAEVLGTSRIYDHQRSQESSNFSSRLSPLRFPWQSHFKAERTIGSRGAQELQVLDD